MAYGTVPATAVLGWSQVSRFEPAIYELLLHESVKYLLHQVKDLKELLAAREQALQTASGGQQKGDNAIGAVAPSAPAANKSPAQSVASSSFSAAASTASLFASRFLQSEQTAEETESHRKRAQFLSNLITGALLSEEIDRFRCVVDCCSYGDCGSVSTISGRLTDFLLR